MALDMVRRSAAAVAVMGIGLLLAAAAAELLAPPAPWIFDIEVSALMDIKEALRDPSGVLNAWDPTLPGAAAKICNWPKVICNGMDQVDRLDLTDQNLSGTLSSSIGSLTSMQILNLAHNSISGPIPDSIGQIQHLEYLDLSNNHFTGSIPSALGSLAYLRNLELNNNSLSGHIPDSLATASMLTHLDLSFNNLSGPLPIFRHTIIFVFTGNPLLNPPAAKEPHVLPKPKPAKTEDGVFQQDRILAIVAVCLTFVCIVILITRLFKLCCHRRRRHEQADEADDGAVDDVSSAISLTDSVWAMILQGS